MPSEKTAVEQSGIPRREETALLLDRLQDGIGQVVRERWKTYYPSRAEGAAPRVTCVRRDDHRAYSVLFEYQLRFPGSGRMERIIAKIRRESRFGGYDRRTVNGRTLTVARAEFDELSRAYEYYTARRDGLGVVRPIDFLDELNTVLIEKASGGDLGVFVKENRPNSLVHLSQCGKWLRLFHGHLHAVQYRPWDPSGFETGLRKKRERLLAHGVPSRKLNVLLEMVGTATRSLPRQDVPCSLLHGDYKLRHVWAGPEAIQVLDFGNIQEGECYRDVAAFLVELIVLRFAKPWFAAERIERYAEAFLEGYFGEEPSPAVLPFYVIDSLLKKWDRRLGKWTGHRFSAKIQGCLRAVKVAPIVDRLYLDRWFATRIQEWLARVGRVQCSVR